MSRTSFRACLTDDASVRSLMNGMCRAADAMKRAYGPKGDNFEIGCSLGERRHTKQGDLIIDAVDLDNPIEARGAEMLKLAVRGMATRGGDGATTTAILSEFMIREGWELVTRGANPLHVGRGIKRAVDGVIQYLKETNQAHVAEEQLVAVASVAADNDEEIGTLIGRMIAAGVDPSAIRVTKDLRRGATIRGHNTVGVGPTEEIDVEERARRARRALHSVREAIEGGVVPGGGAALLHAARAVEALRLSDSDEKHGADMVCRALQEPARQLAINAKLDPEDTVRGIVVADNVQLGFDVVKRTPTDMYAAGIIDPHMVVSTAVNRAGKLATAFLKEIERVVTLNLREGRGGSEGDGESEGSGEGYYRGFPRGGPISEPEHQPTRYLVGNLPEQVPKDVVVELTVQVSYTPVPGRSDELKLETPPEGVTLDILVIAEAFEFEGPRKAPLFVPAAGKSALVGFRLKALIGGKTEVYVEAFHGGTKVAGLTLYVTVAAAGEIPPTAERASKLGSVAGRSGDVSLLLNPPRTKGEPYRFTWIDEGGCQEEAYTQKTFLELKDATKNTTTEIEEIVRLDYNTNSDVAKRKLKASGIDMWEQLIPLEIRNRFISRHDNIKRITIYSDADPFPWEMLYPFRKDPYFDFGQFLIERVEVCHWKYGSTPPNRIQVRRADFVLADQAKLNKAAAEVKKITVLLTKWNEALQHKRIEAANELYDLFERELVSLLHFACHQSGVHPLPQHHRARCSSWKSHPRHRRQLRRSQTA